MCWFELRLVSITSSSFGKVNKVLYCDFRTQMCKHEKNHEKVFFVCVGFLECRHKTKNMVDKMFLIESYGEKGTLGLVASGGNWQMI